MVPEGVGGLAFLPSHVLCPRATICPSLRAIIHLRPANGAHNRHTGRRGEHVLSGFARGVIDPGVSVAVQIQNGARSMESGQVPEG